MKQKARAVVVGGGVVGVSMLYHLARKGWDDCVLIERKELTSGSTWHAAGLLPLFNMSYSVGQVHKYSVRFYQELAEETGMDTGFRKVSNVRLARSEPRWDEYKYYMGVAETIGINVKILTPDEIGQLWPYVNTDGLLGAIQHVDDGYIQPADLTQALAKGARDMGGTIYRNTVTTGFTQTLDGWVVHTDKGDIECEHVISCTGNFARKTGAMVGLNVPVIPVEHQYIVTEAHPEIKKFREGGGDELCVLRESDSAWYMREEAHGLLLGPYEKGAPCCYVDGPSDQSEYELFQEDLDRLAPHIETAIERVPYFGEAGIKKVYNGAIAYTPDGNPIIGPAPGLKGFWLSEGHSFGVTAAGGAGWQLAEWIVEGEPSLDMMGVDPRRFGPYATEGYLIEKNEEAYRNVFTLHFPDEERAAARPLKTSPSYERQKALGAVFGSVYGWERANWYAPEGYELPKDVIGKGMDGLIVCDNHAPADHTGKIREEWSFRRANYFEHVGNEVRAVTQSAGLLDMSAFAKIEVSGEGARDWLNSIFANSVPKKRGRIALCHLLTKFGGVKSEFTVYEWKPDHFYLVSAGAYESHDHDTLFRHLPDDNSVTLKPITQMFGVLVLAGPNSRKVLQKLTRTPLDNASFPWLSGKEISLGSASAHALRVNFVGELGWELHHPIEQQNAIWDQVMAAGEEFDIKPFGIRAMTAMAIEKSYRLIPRELSIEYSAYESALDRFIKLDKDFIGKDALVKRHTEGDQWKFVTLAVDGCDKDNVDPRGSEAIYKGDEPVGRATHGGFGFRIGKSIALAMVKPEYGEIGNALEIRILGERYKATIIEESPFDPKNERLRADG